MRKKSASGETIAPLPRRKASAESPRTLPLFAPLCGNFLLRKTLTPCRRGFFPFGSRILALAGVVACLAVFPLCARLTDLPRPAAVPEGAERDRRSGLWTLRTETEVVTYYSDGNLYARGPLVRGVRHGLWSFYALDGKMVLSQGVFSNDWREGVWKFYDERGRLYLTMTYGDEKREFIFLVTHDYGNENGPYMRYYPDGKLEEEGSFRAGYFEGPVTRYHPNGKVLLKGQYQKDLIVGRWLYYYPNGTLLREENYTAGALDGILRSFYPDGRFYMETAYKNGTNIGPGRVER